MPALAWKRVSLPPTLPSMSFKRARKGSFAYQLLSAHLKRYARPCYSQWGEDIVLETLLRERERGVYVDVGCFHPRRFSNTYALYRRGWSGVNIDASPLKIRLFDALRPRDRNVLAAVTESRREVTLFKFGEYSVLDTLDEATAKEWSALTQRRYEEQTIQGLPLNDILAETLKGQRIDLLNVDVEGHELAVLESFDFAAYQPAVLVVEVHAKAIAGVLDSPVYALLTGHGYRLSHWLSPSLIFQRGPELDAAAGEA